MHNQVLHVALNTEGVYESSYRGVGVATRFRAARHREARVDPTIPSKPNCW